MNKELLFIHKWLHSNCLTLNSGTKKSLYVVFKRNRAITNANNEVCINNVELDKCSNTKYLGIYIEENLNWGAAPLLTDFNFLPIEQINKYMSVIFVHR